MPVNLINEKELNEFLSQNICGYEAADSFSAEKLKSKDFVKRNSDMIADAIASQWMKAKFRNFLTENDKAAYLEPVTRMYPGCPKWLFRAFVAKIPVYRFRSERLPFDILCKIGCASLYVREEARRYLERELKKTQPKVRLDYLKTDNKLSSIEQVLKLYGEDQKKIDFSAGTKRVLSFPDGFSIVQLLGENAFMAEGRGMDHCIARDAYFANYSDSHKFFSVRDRNNYPHATFQVDRNGYIVQARSKGDTAVPGKYHKYIYAFMNKYGIKASKLALEDIGLLEAGGKVLSIYSLAKAGPLYLQDLNVGDYRLRNLPDFSNITVENFDISNSMMKNIKGCARAKTISMYDSVKFDEDFLKDLPPEVEKIEGYSVPLKCLKHLPRSSNLKEIELNGNDFRPEELLEIPFYTLRKLSFDGGSRDFYKAYDEALETAKHSLFFMDRIKIASLIRSAG